MRDDSVIPTLPKISIVTPSFNQGLYIEDTIRSVLDQGYPNVEHIVIDGGSSDTTAEVLARYAHTFAYWVSEPDSGQTHALIKGFERATGDVLCWLNSDDLFEPGALLFVGEHFRDHPENRFVYGDSLWVDKSNNYLKPKKEHTFNRFIWLHDHNYFPQPSCFWRRDLYLEVGGLDRRFDLAMDADLFIRFADLTRPVHLRRILSRMRSYPEQKNKRLRAQSDREDRNIRSRYLADRPPLLRYSQWLTAKTMRVAMKTISGCYTR